MSETNILKPGRNCWRVEEALWGRFLIDGAVYFSDLFQQLKAAKHTIYIAGWDFDTRIRLERDDSQSLAKLPLGKLLDHLAKNNPELNIKILIWDFPAIYASDREWLLEYKIGWGTSHQIAFRRDDQHPISGSHHQKFVVIDNRVAFCGGLDLTAGRWDTREHKINNPMRSDPGKVNYSPFHDIQMRLAGPVVHALEELFRERWFWATGEKLPPMPEPDAIEKPIEPYDFSRAGVGISRTSPRFKGRSPIREIERAFSDLLAVATKSIYIENQYLTSPSIAHSLVRQLKKKNGPEVTIILPLEELGILEQATMGVLRSKVFWELRRADRHRRLAIFCPIRKAGQASVAVKVHSKVLIIDDRYVMAGSANLNNRSLGLDTECNIIFDGYESEEMNSAVINFKADLLSELAGVLRSDVPSGVLIGRGINDWLRAHNLERDRLHEVQESPSYLYRKFLAGFKWIDAKRPTEIEYEVEEIFDEDSLEKWRSVRRRFVVGGLALAIITALFFVIRYDLLRRYITQGGIADFLVVLEHTSFHSGWVLFAFIAASSMFIPLNILILAVATLYGPLPAMGISFSGALLSALVGYWGGSVLGPRTLDYYFHHTYAQVSKKVATVSWLPVALLRLIPIAPYALVNFAAGAVKTNFRSYMIGTGVGLLPGVISLVLFQRGLIDFILEPNWSNGFLVIAILVLIVAFLRIFKRRFIRVRA